MSDWSRRDLLKQAVAMGLPPCCGTPRLAPGAYRAGERTVVVDLAAAPELRQKGGSARIVDGARGIDLIVARPGRRRYAALDTACTHGSAPVAYKPKQKTMQCTCWGRSEFALDGRVLGGPAKRALRVYPTALSGQMLTIDLAERA
jgi:Rieske Fe-S protein